MAATLRNAARERLDRDELALGIILRQARTVDIAPIMKAAGFDWLFLDLEHGTMSIDAAAQIATAALDASIAPLARVPNGEYSIATRLLDNGVLGIVVPHVDPADEAREVVQKLKYPPVGHRSMGGTGPHYSLRSASTGDAAKALNAANLTVVMLETPTAIQNADAIAAVPGVDVLLIGTNDLCAEMGIHGDFGNERVADAYRTMIAAAKKHAKFPGMAG
jgi:4-hydroxy-2-oxoheptanedioate aldolase